MSLRARLYLIVVAPLLALCALIAIKIYIAVGDQAEAERVALEVEWARSLSDLAHELQKERGMSAGNVGSAGAAFAAELFQQRKLTDLLIARKRAELTERAAQSAEVASIVEGLGRLTAFRANIDDLSVTVPDVAAYYTGMITATIERASAAFKGVNDLSVRSASYSYRAVMLAKEAAGLERAMGAVGFGRGEFPQTAFDRFGKLQGRQAARLADARLWLSGPELVTLTEIETGPELREVERLRSLALGSKLGGDLDDVKGSEWFAASTKWIDELKRLEDQIGDMVAGHAAALDQRSRSDLNESLLLLALLGVISLVPPIVISRKTSRQIKLVMAEFDAIAEGDLDRPPLQMRHGDTELAALARMAMRLQAKEKDTMRLAAEAEQERAEREEIERAAKKAEEERRAAELEAKEERLRLEREAAETKQAAEAARLAEEARQAEEDVARARAEAEERAQMDAAAKAEEARRAAELNAIIAAVREALNRIANGDLETGVADVFGQDHEELKTDFDVAISRLRTVLTSVLNGLGGIETSAQSFNAAASDLATRTERQAHLLDSTTERLRQFEEGLNETAEITNSAAGAAESARSRAERSGKVASDAIGAITKVKESSDQIFKINKLIEDIAFQTNLLALNAGVEAARAGESGRGFSVVANEVRGLAVRASEAAQEITELVEKSASYVDEGVAAVTRTGETLKDIAEGVDAITDDIARVRDAAAAQTVEVRAVSEALSKIDNTTKENAAMAEESTAAAHQLSDDVASLNRDLEEFRKGDAAQEERAAA